MPICLNCNTTDSLPDFPYCQKCNDELAPSKLSLTKNGGHTLEYMQERLKEMAHNAKLHPPIYVAPKKSIATEYMEMSFQDLKDLEKQASQWLLSHTSDPNYQEAKQKYTILVKVLNKKSGAF